MTGIFIGPINYYGMTPESMAVSLVGGLPGPTIGGVPRGAPGGFHGPVPPIGMGAVNMVAAGDAYSALAEALRTAAGNSADSMNLLSTLWSGPSSDRAKSSFDAHATWLNANAVAADTSATQAYAAATAYELATGVVVPAGNAAWIAWQAQTAAATTGATATPTGSATMAAAQIVYNAMRSVAAGGMTTYDGTMFSVTGALPAPAPAPDIAAPGGGPGGNLPAWTGGSPQSYPVSYVPGPTGGGPAGGNPVSQPPSGSNPPGGTQPPPGGTQPPPGGTQPPPGGGDPTPGNPVSPDGSTPLPDGSAPGDSGTTPGMSTTDPGFSDPAQGSTTLAGLNGGVGSAVSLSLARGGLGSMSSPASGFRMPGTWQNSGRAFGAGVGEPEPEPMAPRRGVVAPSSRMRRRRDEERSSGRVFVPGEPLDVPVLEQPPAIGVIEYVADDQ